MAEPDDETSASTTEAGDGDQTKPPGEKAKPPREPGGGGNRDAKKIAEVINFFQGQVHAGTIGKSGGAGGDARGGRRAATGRLDDEEIRRDLRHYCRPDAYDDAIERLTRDHVVALCGPAGLGKRAGAVSLLREVTGGQLVVLSAVSDFKQLSTRSYDRGSGYLIVNRSEGDKGSEADFAWRTVRGQVRDAGAFLVVTTLAEVDPQVQAVRQLAWRHPDSTTMAKAYLAERDLPADEITRIVERLGAELPMTEIAGALIRIRDGETVEAVLDSLAETSARRVRDWFDAHTTEKDLAMVLDVAAMAMLGEVTHREFEAQRAGLEAAMRRHGVIKPAAGRKKEAAEPGDLNRRHRRTSDDGLLVERQVVSRTSVRKVLDFRTETYREHALAELARRFEMPFWNATAEWLAGIVIAHGPVAEVAIGLGLLAAADFDEVELCYLTPWSKGEIGPHGQVLAVYVLWVMCFKEETMPIALKVAKHWANHGDGEQRWTAAMAYSGEVGSREPAQAIKQLWQLISSSGSGYEQACFAMAVLFGTLIGTADARKVLSTLVRQVHRVPERREHRVLVERARHVLAELLALRENQHHVPVTLLYVEQALEDEPDPAAARLERIALVSRLWADGIRCRPYRAEVLDALWQGLSRLDHVAEDPIRLATQLGEALVRALPADEVDDFYDDLRTAGHRRRLGSKNKTKQSNRPALVLLDVVSRYYRRKAS
ncbi:hypothetical protein [Actinoplanes sp. NPDC089786]|uniref:hypothetical protein n=1 Tax=Actinoplanes sp. NPDC089786 TaxID=3155185 RepID=UPI003419322E